MTATIRSAQLFALDIPFQLAIAHASHTRTSSDSVVLRLETNEGVVGYGEAAPRPYVTGETVRSVMDSLEQHIGNQLVGRSIPGWQEDLRLPLSDVESMLPDPHQNPNIVAAHAARAALEVALLDCVTSAASQPLSAVFPEGASSVTYSGMLPTLGDDRALELARMQKAYGITRIKVKVGDENDVARVRLLREELGPDFDLYVDANCAWTVNEAVQRIKQMTASGITLIEQPIPRGNVEDLARLREQISIPLMVDESLVTLADAHELIEAKACDIFNIRISKCGGLANCMRLAQLAEAAGLEYQLGAHVGETAILSAAGRHLGLALRNARYVEGSSGGFLLSEDVSTAPLQFEPGGKGHPLRGPGLGIDVDLSRLKRLSCQHRTIGEAS